MEEQKESQDYIFFSRDDEEEASVQDAEDTQE